MKFYSILLPDSFKKKDLPCVDLFDRYLCTFLESISVKCLNSNAKAISGTFFKTVKYLFRYFQKCDFCFRVFFYDLKNINMLFFNKNDLVWGNKLKNKRF